MTPCILGIDPGLAHMGLVCVQVTGPVMRLVAARCVRTKPSSRKLRVLVTSDTVRRAQELLRALQEFVAAHQPALICAEAMSYPRSSASAAKLALSWGLLVSLELPIIQATPQQIKVAMTGKANATKAEVQDAVEWRLPGALDGVAKGLREHVADAIGAVCACRNSTEMRILENVPQC